MANPLLHNGQFPRFRDVQPVHVQPAMLERLQQAETALETLEHRLANHTPSYSELAGEIERIGELVSAPWSVVSHLKAVNNSDDLRSAHAEALPAVVQFGTRVAQSEALYRAWERLRQDQTAWEALTPQQRRVAELQLLEGKLAGVGLTPEDTKRHNEIKTELAQLSSKFSDNVLDATKEWVHQLEDPADVAGLPVWALQMMADSARSRGFESATAEAGPWTATLDGPCYVAIMQHAHDPGLREAVYRAYLTRASEFGPDDRDNAPVIDQVLRLRSEKAALLGFNSHAEVSLASKMASLQQVKAFLEDLRAKSYDAAVHEHEELVEFAGKALENWDVAYYAEKLKSETLGIDDEMTRPYFALDAVLGGLFGVVDKLFGVSVHEVPDPSTVDAQVWDPSVRLFELRDSSATTVAYFFLDPFARASNKRAGAWMNEVAGRSKAMARDGQEARIPIAHMVTNQPPPSEGIPSLMSFRDVETLFHECGHALQHMLTSVDEGMVSGIRGVEWDAVEQPSQFMEYWCYQQETLNSMAKHWQTGQPIPHELVTKLQCAKTFRSASAMLRQLKFASVDLELHQSGFAGSDESIWEADARIAQNTQVLPSISEDRFLCGFSHIFAGGYSAGYYSYKWAEVLSADGFAAFEEIGLDDREAVQRLGAKYAETVLGRGGSASAAEVFLEFRGRAPSVEPLLRHSGLQVLAPEKQQPVVSKL